MVVPVDVSAWLRALGLERYVGLFEENEISSDVLADLTDEHLKELGIALGPRVKLLKAIQALTREGDDSDERGRGIPNGDVGAGSTPERRHLTVMFCDLVGSTALAAQFDPEDLSAIVRAFQDCCAGIISRYQGYVARYMGDGLLVYFGYPQAHEDDAERALRAGVEIIESVCRLRTRPGLRLQTRVGVATGLVVVGQSIGEASSREQVVMGETPNLAARLQGAADPDTMLISPDTRGVVGDLFEYADLGDRILKGFEKRVRVWRVTGERSVESRFEARSADGLRPMVGRDHELALMLERWGRARSGEGQLVLLSGEAGIGKSRIARAICDAIADDEHLRISYQCSPYHGDSAFYPVIRQLLHASGVRGTESTPEKLDKLEALLLQAEADITETAPLVAALLGIDGTSRYGELNLTLQQRRTATLRVLVSQLVGLSRKRPVLVLLEDAHWIDPTTLEMVDLSLDVVTGERVLLAVTARPTFDHGFGGHPIVTRLALNRLGQAQTREIVAALGGEAALAEELADEIVAKTDGVPLFVEELTKSVLESRSFAGAHSTGDGRAVAIPSSLHDSLMARLDRMRPVKEVAQAAACIGREFDFDLLATISPVPDSELADALERLVGAELVFRRGVPPDAHYTFKHALVRDAAYGSLLNSRRQHLHGRLLDHLESQPRCPAEILALHATAAGISDRAVEYWARAGQEALSRPAFREAVGHLRNAIRLTQAVDTPESVRARELDLQISLGQALIPVRGYGHGETAEAFARAMELSGGDSDPRLRFAAYFGRWVVLHNRGENEEAERQAVSFQQVAEEMDDDSGRVVAGRCRGSSRAMMGLLEGARAELLGAEHVYREDEHGGLAGSFGQDLLVAIHCYQSFADTVAGRFGSAAAYLEQVRERSIALGHANTLAYGETFQCISAVLTRNMEVLEISCTRLEGLVQRYGFALWAAFAHLFRGALMARSGEPEALVSMERGREALRGTRSHIFEPLFRLQEVEVMRQFGRAEDAERHLDLADEAMASSSEYWVEAELLRLRGDLALDRGQVSNARRRFAEALERAESRGHGLWRLRAGTSLARLLSERGAAHQAREILAPILEEFAGETDGVDLRDARQLPR